MEDSIKIKESLSIALVKDGHTIQTMEYSGHTWKQLGLNQIRNFLVGVSAAYPSTISLVGSNTLYADCTGYQGPSSSTYSVARWEATFTSGSANNITLFKLLGEGITFSEISTPSFGKPADVDLEIKWYTTISAV